MRGVRCLLCVVLFLVCCFVCICVLFVLCCLVPIFFGGGKGVCSVRVFVYVYSCLCAGVD